MPPRINLRLAVLSLHTCPLASPGVGDAGGLNVYVRNVVRAMADRGVPVDIYTRAAVHGARRAIVSMGSGARLIRLGAGTGNADRWVEPFAAEVVRFARRDGARYRGVVSQYWLSGLVANRLRHAWAAPHVAGFHTLSLPKSAAFRTEPVPPKRLAGEREVATKADGLLATTEHERDVLTHTYKADPAGIHLAPPGVDGGRFFPRARRECRRRLGLPLDGNLLLFAGRMIPLKGIEILIEALARVRREKPMSAVIVGGTLGSRQQKTLAAQSRRLGLGGAVQFVGRVRHGLMPIYYGAADLCAVPSYYESFGMVALEAMACGRPVVASRVGGLASLLQHGRTGLLVRPGSVEELAAGIREVVGDRGFRQTARVEGQRVACAYTWEATAAGVLGAVAGAPGR